MALFLPERTETLAIRAPANPDANAEAVEWFRNRVPLHPREWRALDERAQRRAFTVAGATRLDVVSHVWHALDRAIAHGTDFTQFKRDVGQSLRDAWAGTDPKRLAVIFRNNVQSAYSAGRWAQMRSPDVLQERPVWRFEAILDSRTSPICQPLDGVTLPANDSFWGSNYPPLHHQCRSGVMTLAADEVDRFDAPPEDYPGAQSGWGGAPDLSEWAPNERDYPAPLWAAYQRWKANQ